MGDDLFERRQAERQTSLNLLEYDILSPGGEIVGMGMARTVNISGTGLLLETGQFFDAGQRLRITLSLDGTLVRLVGQVVHSRPVDDDMCNTGVIFLEFDAANRSVFQSFYEQVRRSDD